MDFAAKHLSVTRSIVSQVVGVCKTEASQKPVRLHESLAQALLEWRRHTSFRKREDWVFASPHSNGKRPYWAQPIMRYHVAPASRRIQLQKRVGWHTFRHTFASRLLERGVDIMTVKELLGHSTVTVTMRYTHSNLDSKVAAVGKLAGNCYNPATPCTKLQQSPPNVSQIRR